LIVEFSIEEGLEAHWDEPRISELVRAIVDRERPGGTDHVISLHLVGNDTIRALNATHRAIDASTDVLSFPLHPGADFVLPRDQPVHLGDVVISHPRAVEQATEFGHSIDREVAYLVVHGVLHILGYDHEVPEEQQLMRAREEEALQPLGFTR
jgi:probable rRNA maturation factor